MLGFILVLSIGDERNIAHPLAPMCWPSVTGYLWCRVSARAGGHRHAIFLYSVWLAYAARDPTIPLRPDHRGVSTGKLYKLVKWLIEQKQASEPSSPPSPFALANSEGEREREESEMGNRHTLSAPAVLLGSIGVVCCEKSE